eukprot:309911-Prymnesium_polylepis.1
MPSAHDRPSDDDDDDDEAPILTVRRHHAPAPHSPIPLAPHSPHPMPACRATDAVQPAAAAAVAWWRLTRAAGRALGE